MSQQRMAILSSVFTTGILVLCEGILYANLPRDEFGDFFYLRINLLSVLALFFISNWIFIRIAFRKHPFKERAAALKKSLLYTFLILLVVGMQLVSLQHHIQSGEPIVYY
jgi:hypothetical protein